MDEAEARLLRRLQAAEDAAAAIVDTPPIRWITEQAAMTFRKLGDLESEVAVLQRYLRRGHRTCSEANRAQRPTIQPKLTRERLKRSWNGEITYSTVGCP